MTVESLPQPLIFTRLEQMPVHEVFAIASGVAVVHSARSPGKETENEDAAVLIPVDAERAILAVADGVGGHQAGAVAAERALRALARCVADTPPDDGSFRPAIVNGVEAANEAVTQVGQGAATTLAIVEINGDMMRPYHVGDSVILLVGQRGKLKFQSVAHSPVGYAVESGLLDATEAIHHADRHIVSNVVGTADMRIDIGPVITMRPRDTLVLGSDGLFDNLHAEEVVEVVRKGSLEAAATRLVELCLDRMTRREPGVPSKPDDLTFVIYRPRPAAPGPAR
ncbi:MAG: PP2C family protein-serine/threonine phosphatase [Planctomycetota bacterium]